MLWAPSALPTQWKVTQPRNGEDNNLRPVMEIRNIREPRLLIVFCIRLFLFCSSTMRALLFLSYVQKSL